MGPEKLSLFQVLRGAVQSHLFPNPLNLGGPPLHILFYAHKTVIGPSERIPAMGLPPPLPQCTGILTSFFLTRLGHGVLSLSLSRRRLHMMSRSVLDHPSSCH